MEKCVVVDRNDVVLGSEPRKGVHSSGVWHRGVHILLMDNDRALLQKRALNKDTFPGRWDYSVSEHVLPGESYEAAAKRGLREELGIKAELGKVAHLRMEYGPKDLMLAKVYKGSISKTPSFDKGEVSEVGWFSLTEMDIMARRSPEKFTKYFLEFYKWMRGMESEVEMVK